MQRSKLGQLTSEEYAKCNDVFGEFVQRNRTSRISSLWKLRTLFLALAQSPTDEELRVFLPDEHAVIEFDDFVKILESKKAEFAQPPPADSDMKDAFRAVSGGSTDAEVSTEVLKQFADEFDLRLDMQLVEEFDADNSGTLSYDEFAKILSLNGASGGPSLSSEPDFAALTPPDQIDRKPRWKPQKAAYPPARPLPAHPTSPLQSKEALQASDDPEASHATLAPPPAAVKAATHVVVEYNARVPVGMEQRKTCVIASGAKKTSEQRPLTKDELLEVKLRRLELVTKRPRMLGGDPPPIQVPCAMPDFRALHAKLAKRIGDRKRAAAAAAAPLSSPGKPEAPEAAAAAPDRLSPVCAHVYPGRRARRFDMAQRLEAVSSAALLHASVTKRVSSRWASALMASEELAPQQHRASKPPDDGHAASFSSTASPGGGRPPPPRLSSIGCEQQQQQQQPQPQRRRGCVPELQGMKPSLQARLQAVRHQALLPAPQRRESAALLAGPAEAVGGAAKGPLGVAKVREVLRLERHAAHTEAVAGRQVGVVTADVRQAAVKLRERTGVVGLGAPNQSMTSTAAAADTLVRVMCSYDTILHPLLPPRRRAKLLAVQPLAPLAVKPYVVV
ncbi:Dynein 18 kDa light chain [Diplonema papillatum]|nr:Dynein 18 kDa light chain [Diplonema papillatum]